MVNLLASKEQPLTPTLCPYEGEREDRSQVFQRSDVSGLPHGFLGRGRR
jgi:hypothetical protein